MRKFVPSNTLDTKPIASYMPMTLIPTVTNNDAMYKDTPVKAQTKSQKTTTPAKYKVKGHLEGPGTATGEYAHAINTSSASGDYSFAGGQRGTAAHNNSFIWTDGTTVQLATGSTSAVKQFIVNATGSSGNGVKIYNGAAGSPVTSATQTIGSNTTWSYVPGVPANWSSVPSNVADALDNVSAILGSLNWNVIYPPQITSNQNDYNPTGLSSAKVMIVSTNADLSITGIMAPSSAPNHTLMITNSGTFRLKLVSQSSSSVAANRFTFDGTNVNLNPGQNYQIFYDFVNATWRGMGASNAGSFGSRFITSNVNSVTISSGTKNDFDINDYTIVRVTANVGSFISGFNGGTAGRYLVVVNVGINTFILTDMSVSSSAAGNKISLGGNTLSMVTGSSCTLIYDAVSSVWRLANGSGGASVSGSSSILQTLFNEVNQDMSTSVLVPPVYATISTGGAIGSTITVASTTGFASTGQLIVATTSGQQVVSYTGLTTTTFTGCTKGAVPGTGNMVAGYGIYQNQSAAATSCPVTTIASTSNGISLPTSTINLTSSTGFSGSATAAGIALIMTSAGAQKILFTGISGNQLTGCTGGTGTLTTGAYVTYTPDDLFTTNITTTGGALVIDYEISSLGTSNKTNYFAMIVDGVFRRGSATNGNGVGTSVSCCGATKITGLSPGAHTVLLQWYTTNTCSIQPISNPNVSCGALRVQEFTN